MLLQQPSMLHVDPRSEDTYLSFRQEVDAAPAPEMVWMVSSHPALADWPCCPQRLRCRFSGSLRVSWKPHLPESRASSLPASLAPGAWPWLLPVGLSFYS